MCAAVLMSLLNLVAFGAEPAADMALAQIPEGYTLQYYDDCGVRGRQPHVPAQVGHLFSPGQVEGNEQARSVTYGTPHFEVLYDGLEAGKPYALAVTYASERGNPRVQRLTAGAVLLHEPMTLPDGHAQRFLFAVPPEALLGGKLRLDFHCESGHNAVASIIELWAPLPPRDELHLTLNPSLTGFLEGHVGDVAYAPLPGVPISVKNVNTGACVETRTGDDGTFSQDLSVQVAKGEAGDFAVTARHENLQVSGTVPFDALRFEEPVIRPLPSQTAGTGPVEVSLDGVWGIRPKQPRTDQNTGGHDYTVPGQWLQQGFDFPRDSEVCLQRVFAVPEAWTGKRVFLRFESVHGGAHYQLNGQDLGYRENLFTPIEFDVTEAVHCGQQNTLLMTVTVNTPSELASFSSDYAFHNLGGIDRSVRIFALPTAHVSDLYWTTDFDAACRDAVLSLHLDIENAAKEAVPGLTCVVSLSKVRGGKTVAAREEALGETAPGTSTHEIKLPVQTPQAWSDEKPSLYALSVLLLDKGQVLERIDRRVGFRSVAAHNGQLLINGRSVKLAGVNRHEVDPLTGRAATACHAFADVRLFKAGNFNYVRTSHYPPTGEFLDACDELGLYVECEAPFCWARGGHGENDPSLSRQFLTPTAAMLRANRNHPSIIFWSIANESGNGPDGKNELPANFKVNMDYCRRNDPSRLVLFNNEWARDGGLGDIAVLHYPGWPPESSEFIKTDPRPVLMDEYFPPQTFTFAETLKRNPGLDVVMWSGGENRAESFWNQVWKSPNMIGGAIWAGIDEEFLLPGGKTAGYGAWGFIDGWRRPKSLLWDAKLLFSPVHLPVRQVDWAPGQSTVEIPVLNRYAFTDLNELSIGWEVREEHGTEHMDLAPGQEGKFTFKVPTSAREGDLVALRFHNQHGDLISAHGVRLGREIIPPAPTPNAGCPEWKDEGKVITVSGEGFALALDKAALTITGDTALEAFPRFFVTRLEEKNVFNPGGAAYAEFPDPATRTVKKIEVVPGPETLSIAVTETYTGYEGATELRIDKQGQCQVRFDYAYTGEAFKIGELGLQFLLNGRCDAIDWRRKAEWDVLPEEHIGRAAGHASAHADSASGQPGTRPEGPWPLDANEFGTRDFRATKYNVYEASVVAPDGRGLRVYGEGSTDVRACLYDGLVAVHVLQSEERGEKTLPWPLGPAPRPLKPETPAAGTFSVGLLPKCR